MTWSADDWQRLGDRLRAGRRNAGYSTKEAFAEVVGISSKTYGDIEAGRLGKRGSFSFDTIAQIEDVLEWEPGVSRMILDGKDVDLYSGIVKPAYLPEEPSWGQSAKEQNDYSNFAWLDERVERLEERLLKVERALRTTDQRKEGGDNGTQTSAQKSELEKRRALKQQEVSDVDDTLSPAADRFDKQSDEESGGSADRD